MRILASGIRTARRTYTSRAGQELGDYHHCPVELNVSKRDMTVLHVILKMLAGPFRRPLHLNFRRHTISQFGNWEKTKFRRRLQVPASTLQITHRSFRGFPRVEHVWSNISHNHLRIGHKSHMPIFEMDGKRKNLT